jgi:hypothetical protein
MLCFFRSLIDFDWIKCHLISDQVGSGQFDFLKKLSRIGFRLDLNPDGSIEFLGSDFVTSNFHFVIHRLAARLTYEARLYAFFLTLL